MEVLGGVNFQFLQDRFFNKPEITSLALEGASRSGKSWDICLFITLIIEKYTNLRIVVARDYRTTLISTTYKTFEKVWRARGFPQQNGKVFNEGASTVKFNGNRIEFIGINDNVDKAYGLEPDILWINECQSIDKEGFNQLKKRTDKLLIVDYNPTHKDHYLYNREKLDYHETFKTTIFDNINKKTGKPFAPANQVREILGYAHPELEAPKNVLNLFKSLEDFEKHCQKNVENGTADKFNWNCFGLGKRGLNDDAVFKYWKTFKEFPESYNIKLYGGDFGYIDAFVMIEIVVSGRDLYLKELLYESGMLLSEAAKIIKQNGWIDKYSVWDSSRPDSIAELRKSGIPAFRCTKGRDSIGAGIARMRGYNIYIHQDSKNLIREFENYVYKKDKLGNYVFNKLKQRVPEENQEDHGIDSARYGFTLIPIQEWEDK